MSRRTELQTILEKALGSNRVYFQPPPTFQMDYPCIVYHLGEINFFTLKADNHLYGHRKTYTAIYIDPNPDNDIVDKLIELEYCRFERHYAQDNLNHDVFTIYY